MGAGDSSLSQHLSLPSRHQPEAKLYTGYKKTGEGIGVQFPLFDVLKITTSCPGRRWVSVSNIAMMLTYIASPAIAWYQEAFLEVDDKGCYGCCSSMQVSLDQRKCASWSILIVQLECFSQHAKLLLLLLLPSGCPSQCLIRTNYTAFIEPQPTRLRLLG